MTTTWPSAAGSPALPIQRPDQARAQLERILASPDFQSTPQRKALLRYLVEETLSGRGEQLKGFTVAVSVFGRDAGFDSQADPVVRLEARLLRRDLDGYYAAAGRRDPVRISIPKGRYAARFEVRDDPIGVDTVAEPEAAPKEEVADPPPKPAPSARTVWPGLLLLVVVLVASAAAAGWFWMSPRPEPGEVATSASAHRGPAIIVLPFEALSSDEEDRFLADGITQELIANLMRFADFRLYSVPSSFRQSSQADPLALGRELEVAFVTRGSLRTSVDSVHIVAQLVDAGSGEIVWSETYDRPLKAVSLLAVQDDISSRIAVELGQPYGVINSAATQEDLSGPSLASYACILRAYEYRRTFSDALYPPTRACLEDATRRDPGYVDAWALLGWLHLDAVRNDIVGPEVAPSEMDAAMSAASHAVDLDPGSVRALTALAAARYYRGEYGESERLQRAALALNPNDPETLAQLGWRLAARGEWDEGLAYVRQAIDRTIAPPGWYFHSLAVHAYLEGDYAAALDAAERSARNGSGVGLSLVAMSEAKLGHPDKASQALAAIAEADPHIAADPAAVYRRHQIIEPTVERLVAGLREAGWRAP